MGNVFLVGAGPGDPGLMTEKGMKRLRECDAVVYDHLVSKRLLEEAPEESQKIFVGKKAGCHYKKQEEINRLLMDLAREGKQVVRLKGGDPFVFGRGGEEAAAISHEGIPFEVISGVTSAVAVLASAGIPVTYRSVSSSFHVITGHTMRTEGTLPSDFRQYAKLSGTLVFLMGLAHLSLIVRGLLDNGKQADTPAAVIENGTLFGQRVVRGTLDAIEAIAKAEKIETPAIIVVGGVAALDFSSTYHRSLEGVKVAVTGTNSMVSRLRGNLEAAGAYTECILSLEMNSLRCKEAMKQAYGKLKECHWLVFTSGNAVCEFFKGLLEDGRDYRSVGHMKFAATGRATAQELLRHGFAADYIPERFCVAALAEGLKGVVKEGERLLLPRSKRGSPKLNEILNKAGILYDDIALYDTVLRKKSMKGMEGALLAADYLTFASSSGVDAFFENGGNKIMERNGGLRVACIGAATAKKLEEHGKKADLMAASSTVKGMTEAISKDWNQKKHN